MSWVNEDPQRPFYAVNLVTLIMNQCLLIVAFLFIGVVAVVNAEPHHYDDDDVSSVDSYVVERREVEVPRRTVRYYRRRPTYVRRRYVRPATERVVVQDVQPEPAETVVEDVGYYEREGSVYRYDHREPYHSRRHRYYADADDDSDSGSDEVVNSRVSTDGNNAGNKKSLVNVDRVI